MSSPGDKGKKRCQLVKSRGRGVLLVVGEYLRVEQILDLMGKHW